LETLEQGHHYLLQEKASAWDQYETLREYFDLGQHAQCYYATKELCTHRYTTKEAALATITAFGTRMREANIRTIDQLLPYAYMTLISHGYGTAINRGLVLFVAARLAGQVSKFRGLEYEYLFKLKKSKLTLAPSTIPSASHLQRLGYT
jgi:hypothetical protein